MVTLHEERARLIEMVIKLYKLVDEMLEILESNTTEEEYKRIGDLAKIAEEYKNSITSQAIVFIARFQPLARDLLVAENLISIAYDLYRIARYAREIAILALIIKGLKGIVEDDAIDALKLARNMVREAANAFTTGDTRKIKMVYEDDDLIDEVYHKYLNIIARMDKIDSKTVATLLLARHIERIADHATYIARAAEKTWT
ncbi:MAG: PhoU domain-containing protein [Acidilobaceae archaeon]